MFSKFFAKSPAADPAAAASPAQTSVEGEPTAGEIEKIDFEVNVDNIDMHVEVDVEAKKGVLASEWNGSGGCSHADVASSVDFIPPRYVYGCTKNAKSRWADTMAWRASHGMDSILDVPQPHFHLIKNHWPHFFCGRTPRDNRLVVYEHVGGLKQALTELKERHNVSFQDVMTHYLYITEYQWSILDTKPYDEEDTNAGQMIKVIDFEGITSDCSNLELRTFVTWTLRTIGRASLYLLPERSFVGQHYPERCGVVYLINTPNWFSTLWRVIQRFVSEVTREKIRFCPTSKEYGPKLKAWMGGSKFLPSCMGGPVEVNGTTMLCDDEAKLHAFVSKHTPLPSAEPAASVAAAEVAASS
ncbi:unnamed protein product [Aphanomyces euteiches]